MDTPIFDALWEKYNATPIYDQLVEDYEMAKYVELIKPYQRTDEGLMHAQVPELLGDYANHYLVPAYLRLLDKEQAVPAPSPWVLWCPYPKKEKKLMTNNWQRLVNEFREACDDEVPEFPRTLSPAEAEKHISMIRDEFEKEFVPAFLEQNLVEMYDAGIDVLVYVIGALSNAGFDIDPGFKEVMRNNMTKVDPETGKVTRSRGYELDGEPLNKILKPEGFVPVNLHPIINEQFQFGPEDTTVYRTKDLPLTLGEGGPIIGTADVVMDHNGVMTIDARVDDTEVLPLLEGVSLLDVSIAREEAEEIMTYDDRTLVKVPSTEGVQPQPQPELFENEVQQMDAGDPNGPMIDDFPIEFNDVAYLDGDNNPRSTADDRLGGNGL